MFSRLGDGVLELADGGVALRHRCESRLVAPEFYICRRIKTRIRWTSGVRAIEGVQCRCVGDGGCQFDAQFGSRQILLLQQKQQQHIHVKRARSFSARTRGIGGNGDQQPKRSVHFIGIGGLGLSALAFLALEQGWQVSGSDATGNNRTEALRAAGATVYVGHAPSQITNFGLGLPDAIVVSSAIPENNVEVLAANDAGLPVYKRGEWLGKITGGYELLAVAGSHGKSTTAAMLGTVLRKLGDDVTAVVGAEVPQFPGGGNAIFGRGPRFVLEADEYDGCFLGVTPTVAVVTNVEWEHVDKFADEAAVREIFKKFVRRIKPGGTLVICGDSAGSKSLANVLQNEEDRVAVPEGMPWQRLSHRVLTFGLRDGNDWQALMLSPNVQGGTDYVAVHAGRPMARVSLQLPGTHNVLNSLAVLVVVSLVGSQAKRGHDREDELRALKGSAEAAGRALAQFVGVRRRFEFVGEIKGCVIYDDYAHHPTEVRAVLQAARQRFDRHSIWVVFQPHTYSRLAGLLNDFAPAFSAADRVIVTEVYAAREENLWKISGADLTALLMGPPAVFIPSLDDVVERLCWELTVNETLKPEAQRRVVLLTLGAGDITCVGSRLLEAFQAMTL